MGVSTENGAVMEQMIDLYAQVEALERRRAAGRLQQMHSLFR